MVKMRRKYYDVEKVEYDDKWTKMGMELVSESSMVETTTSEISTKVLQEILAENQRYVSPPRPTVVTPTATTGTTYQYTPVTHRITMQPQLSAPVFRCTHSYVSTMATMAITPTTSTPILSAVKAEIATGDTFKIDDSMVTVSYMLSATDPNQWEPLRITVDKFKNWYADRQKVLKKPGDIRRRRQGKNNDR